MAATFPTNPSATRKRPHHTPCLKLNLALQPFVRVANKRKKDYA
jgi:hypothetical protein